MNLYIRLMVNIQTINMFGANNFLIYDLKNLTA